MPKISKQEAVERAEAFIAEWRAEHPCGALQAVRHSPCNEKMRRYTGQDNGTFYVEFAYSGPPVKRLALPRLDHPTIVVVNDETGDCSIMKWM